VTGDRTGDRTGDGTGAAGPSRVTLMTRRNCSLCDTAAEAVARICAELGVDWSSRDVDADGELRAEYGDRVPVVLVDGREHGYYRVEEPRLRAALGG